MIDGAEVDYLGPWRKYFVRRPGDARQVKKQYRRRVRRLEREGALHE